MLASNSTVVSNTCRVEACSTSVARTASATRSSVPGLSVTLMNRSFKCLNVAITSGLRGRYRQTAIPVRSAHEDNLLFADLDTSDVTLRALLAGDERRFMRGEGRWAEVTKRLDTLRGCGMCLIHGQRVRRTCSVARRDFRCDSMAAQLASGNGSALRPSARQDSVCRVLPSRQAFQALMAIATSASRPDSVEY